LLIVLIVINNSAAAILMTAALERFSTVRGLIFGIGTVN